ncbi:2-oxoacid:acceptor oxidoreductase family protein [uncultured Anaeromusa sp.]|uniref:2-oxoacid:acceptor oxidoreductase family protein n=1 Tax=uncultured Anaeromusa sp. TaxID=673273 RepID=UPI0029C7DB89|nr:2-oxoacid:acceptor oxidoreductase family protein [uncultured Anaeromusa sp.]
MSQTHEIIMSGFGGQGIMLMGQLLTYAGMLEGKEVTWIPSYGPEMRGGTAYCSVIVSEDPIGAPMVSEPSMVVAMNLPSLTRFEGSLQKGGTLIINSSLIEKDATRKDINVFKVPVNEIAAELGNPKVGNMVMLGAIIAAGEPVKTESMLGAFKKMFEKKFANKPELFKINEAAIQRGADFIKK